MSLRSTTLKLINPLFCFQRLVGWLIPLRMGQRLGLHFEIDFGVDIRCLEGDMPESGELC